VWQHSITDGAGALWLDATLEVRDAETSGIVEIFADEDGEIGIENPFEANDGFCRFYAALGRYTITARGGSFERVWENVVLGIPFELLPDLTSILAPICDEVMDLVVASVEAQLATIPQFVSFTVLGTGGSVSPPTGWASSRTGTGEYTVTNPTTSDDYNVKLTVWDPGSDRVYSAMMVSKAAGTFSYRVRSIHDEASSSDARVDIEVTLPVTA